MQRKLTLLVDHPKFAASAELFTKACEASRDHDNLARDMLAMYGDHGPLISGCVREHFPAAVRERLRRLAAEVTYLSDLAYKRKPKRTHQATMRRLASQVAARDGSGFYGPQP